MVSHIPITKHYNQNSIPEVITSELSGTATIKAWTAAAGLLLINLCLLFHQCTETSDNFVSEISENVKVKKRK